MRTLQLNRGSFLVLLMLCILTSLSDADVTPQELQKWVDDSALIFTGRIETLTSNVRSITDSYHPMTVKVIDVQFPDRYELQKFGPLVGKEITVVVAQSFQAGPQRQPGVSATFFVNPLVYENNVAVTAIAIADDELVKDLPSRLYEAVKQKETMPFSLEVKNASAVVTGIVQAIRRLPKTKIDGLRRLANGRDLYSEHSPRWREAVIRVQSVLKPDPKEKMLKMLIVVFPSTEDRMWAKSPKFAVGQRGTWLLHSGFHDGAQLTDERARILLEPEVSAIGQLKVYTALRPEDFRPKDPAGKNEAQIRDVLKSIKP